MVKSTLLARVQDGLPLAASMDDEESMELKEYKDQAKMIFKRLNSPQYQGGEQRCSIESGPYTFHYIIEYDVCYLALCDKNFPSSLAFKYLEELQKEFQDKFGHEVRSVARPYAFVKFDTYIQKTKRQYKDTRTQRNLHRLNEDLNSVKTIMTKNIEDVLGRGEALDRMSQMSNQLKDDSKKYRKDAKNLNLLALYQKYGPVAIVSVVVLFAS